MKYVKQEKKKSKLPLIIGILAFCLTVAAAGVWFFTSEKNTDRGGAANTQTAAVEIQTPYGKLHLEDEWMTHLRYEVIQGDTTELMFAAEIAGTNVKLFDLYLGSEEYLAGYLTTDSGERVPVGVVVHDIVPVESWSEEEEELALTMQDALNEILAQLNVETVLQDVEESLQTATEVSVETSFGVFTYMDFWNGGLRLQETESLISAFGTVTGKPEQKLFEISVGGTGESPVGMYTDKNSQQLPVFLTVSDLVFDGGWTEEEQRQIYGMQNVLNDILEQLDLKAVEQPKETEVVLDDVTLTTSYGTISYPGQYHEKMRIAQDRSNGFGLRVFATMPGKNEIHLFDILIGGSGDIFAGTLTDSYGNSKEVYLNISELNLDDGWTEQDRDDVYVMQTLLNDFCEQLAITREPVESSDKTTGGGDVVVHMSYGSLRYPGEYRKYLATEVNRDNGCTVIFYAKRNTGEKIRLFDLIIDGTGDVYVGQMTAGNGSILDVYVTSYELPIDDSWSDDEIQTIYGMQEAVNYVLDKMEESGTLVY